MTKFVHPLGLGIREWSVLRSAYHGRHDLGIDRYLPALGSRRAVERLVARGFITLDEPLIPIGGGETWLVVKLTDENIATYNKAMEGVQQP